MIAARDSLDHRISGLDWDELLARLDADGFVLTPPVYTPAECAELGGADLAQTAPLNDLLGATHDRLYSRLFLS